MPSEAELIACGKKKKRQAVTQAIEEEEDEDDEEEEEEEEERVDAEKKAMADLVPKYMRRWEDDEVEPTLEERRVALISCRAQLFEMIKRIGCGPILMRSVHLRYPLTQGYSPNRRIFSLPGRCALLQFRWGLFSVNGRLVGSGWLAGWLAVWSVIRSTYACVFSLPLPLSISL
jgi:hypothetical protein